jgi:hypothetical protein
MKKKENEVKMRKILTTAIIALLCVSMFTILVHAYTPPTPGGTADVYLVPSTVTPQLTVPFSVNITVSNVDNLWAWQAGVQWDPTFLQFDHFTWGDFNASIGGPVTYRLDPNIASNALGPALEGAIDGETPLTTTAPVTLLNITFTVIAAGSSTVSLTNVALRGQDPILTTTYDRWSDVNNDGKVDIKDIVLTVKSYLGINPYNPAADFNNDGFNDITDIAIVASDFGKISPIIYPPGYGDWGHTKTILDITPQLDINTPANVGAISVIVAGDLTVTFTSVTVSGTTEATTSNTGPAPPENFFVGPSGAPIYYHITTTASVTAPIYIAIAYDPTISNPTLQHFDPTLNGGLGGWVDVTTSVDTVNHIIWGQVSSLSIFAVMGPILHANVEVDPDTLNLKSKGNWITAYVELPAGFDVNNINVSSILLNNTIAVAPSTPATIGDHDKNAVPDLMVKFNRTALVQYIVAQGIEYANVTLAVKGQLNDGTIFMGSDTIKVSGLVGDVNCDGKVNMKDLSLGIFAFWSRPGEPRWNDNANFAEPWDIINFVDLAKIVCHYGEHYS